MRPVNRQWVVVVIAGKHVQGELSEGYEAQVDVSATAERTMDLHAVLISQCGMHQGLHLLSCSNAGLVCI